MGGVRVLYLSQRYYPFRGGSELVMGELAERLAAEGGQATVYATDAWDLEQFWSRGYRHLETGLEIVNGVPVVRWPVRHLPLGRLAYPVMRRLMTHLSDLPLPGRVGLLERLGRFSPWVPALARRLALQEPADGFDLVHACNVTFESLLLAARDYARRASLPLVVTPFVHLGEPDDRRVGKYYGMAHQMALVRQAAAVIAMTGMERDFLVQRGVPADRITVTGAGVDPAAVTGGDGPGFRQRHGLGSAPLVISVGANAYDKGTVHLVEAVRRLWAAGRTVELALAGARLSHFDHYLASLPAADRRRLLVLGAISDAERRDLYAAADLFAMPSRTDSFGIVYLEAWACGLPVIGARAGAVPEVIRDGVDGLLVRFGDVAGLTQAIAAILDDPARARAMAAAGAATLPERSWSRVYDRTRAVYEQALATTNPHRQRQAPRLTATPAPHAAPLPSTLSTASTPSTPDDAPRPRP
jgi:glycosyltransferase involved in cell wall biosynthesis